MSFYTNVARKGNKFLVRYIDDNGKHQNISAPFRPEMFVVDNHNDSEFKTIYGDNLARKEFDSMSECKTWMEEYKDVVGYNIHGMDNFVIQYMGREFRNKIEFNPDLIRGCIYDIEVFTGRRLENGDIEEGPFPTPEHAEYPVVAISAYDTETDEYIVFAFSTENKTYTHDKNHKKVGKLKVRYIDCDDEYTLLKKFVEWVNFRGFDYISGWNIGMFDNPYLINRAKKIIGKSYTNLLSPWGTLNKRDVKSRYGIETHYDIMGVETLDYIDLYKKHTFITQESYKLDNIANVELNDEKISYDEVGTLNKLYLLDYQKFIEYNIQDTAIVKRLDDKMKLFHLTFTLAYYCKINYQATMKTVGPWDALSYNYLYDKNIVPPLLSPPNTNDDYDGAFVMEPNPGLYKWVVAEDLNSLYPHLEMQYNIGPETIINNNDLPEEIISNSDIMGATEEELVDGKIDLSILKKYNMTMTANKQFFRRDELSFFSAIKRDLYAQRKVVKGSMIQDKIKLEEIKLELSRRNE